ncbi:MAG: hypothetical protein KKE02_15605 [Alphaproteobacteria bacterium]|nr:hypothetical protein [Alphaproteobacteria bacterium]MBU1512711.1 hypothetical protein [Alphaproteobacteria bacterium]MBU2096090.1 hypothetical protein [Alphaproteobacteria bacterium]MBU2152446.1 hypothetical protein [Alphaproteobacteria bacterium]MBU2308020.1 hypothetical protein [Alphaproteobacteria bacterium]
MQAWLTGGAAGSAGVVCRPISVQMTCAPVGIGVAAARLGSIACTSNAKTAIIAIIARRSARALMVGVGPT